jgi:hypothetical protein
METAQPGQRAGLGQAGRRSPTGRKRQVLGVARPARNAEPLRVRGTVPRSFVLLNVCGAHFEAQPGYEGSQPKIPTMFPGCFIGKEKD